MESAPLSRQARRHPPELFRIERADEGCPCPGESEIGVEENGLRSEQMDVRYVLRVLRAGAERRCRAADN